MIPKNAIKKIKNDAHREIAAGSLIAYGIFPYTEEGIRKAKELVAGKEEWLAPSDLPNYYDDIESDLMVGRETAGIIYIRNTLKEFYGLSDKPEAIVDTSVAEGETQVYTPADKFVDDGREFVVNIERNFEDALEETSNNIMDAIDDILRQDQERLEEFKRKQEEELKKKIEKINTPERVSKELTIKIPPAHYIQGQTARWQPEFESDFDHAVYYAGKPSPSKSQLQKDVLTWLKSLGLSLQQIHDHRDKVLQKIRETIALPGVDEEYPYVYIDEVEKDFEIEEDEEDELNDLDDLLNEIRDEFEYEDTEAAEGLDELLDFVRDESISDAEEKETEEKLEEANEIVEDVQINPDLSDLPPGLQESLVNIINKRKGTTLAPEKKEKSTSITNSKIYKFLTTNLIRIQGQLNSINDSIIEQNLLLKSNIDLNIATIQSIESQDKFIETKLNAILSAFEAQNVAAKKFEDDLKLQQTEANLEAQKNSAFTESFIHTGGNGGQSPFLNKLQRMFGKKVAKLLWRILAPKKLKAAMRLARMRAKMLPQKIAGKVASRIAAKKVADKATQQATQRFVAKGFEHIALPAVKSSDNIAAKVVQKPGTNLLTRALQSPAIQKALVKKIGKEGAEKLTLKVAAKLIPGISTAYGLGEGIARIAMGDVKGGFLSFGSAIPVAGYGFAAVDILRDIDTEAYTKHIEGPALSGKLGDEQFAAFFADALGVTEQQYEKGTADAKPGMAMLHGTELIIPKDEQENINPLNIVGGSLLSATSNYINGIGPLGASIAPTFEQVAAPLAKEYDIPKTLTQTKVGGSLPSFTDVFNKVKQKEKADDSSMLDEELEELKTPQSFADKLMDMLKDPFDKFIDAVKNKAGTTDAPPVDGDSLMAEGGYAVQQGEITSGFKTARRPGHMGIDIAGGKFNEGTPISVIKPGKVVFAGWQDPNNHKAGWGQFVAIEHDDGTASLYGHLKSINVSQGQRVEPTADGKFPVIGTLGNTGRSTGPHLHFEVGTGWTGGTLKGHMNPAPLVNQYIRGGGNVKVLQKPDAAPAGAPKGDFDVIIPLDHVKPGNQNKIPDTRGGNTFKNASATGAAGREREHQDSAAAKVRAKLEAKGLRVKVITPEDFGNYEDYDNYIKAQSSKGTRVVPLHFDAAVGQGGTGFLTRTRAGDKQDAALAAPIQAQIAKFQRANPALGNLGSTDTVSNATINRASAAPAALVEMGSMVAWEKSHGKNFTNTATFDKLATGIAEGIYSGGGFNNRLQPSQNQRSRFESLQGSDSDASTKYLIVNQVAKPTVGGQGTQNIKFVPMGDGRWRSKDEYSDSMRKVIMSRLAR